MDLKQKKRLILRFIKLDMDLDRAVLLAECTKAEIERIKNDKRFARRIELERAIFESELLDAHNAAMEIGALKGNTHGIEWRLSKVNPEKWGAGSDKPRGPETVTIIPPPKPGAATVKKKRKAKTTLPARTNGD